MQCLTPTPIGALTTSHRPGCWWGLGRGLKLHPSGQPDRVCWAWTPVGYALAHTST